MLKMPIPASWGGKMGSRYGLASALSDIDRGYEQEEDRQAKKASGAQSSEMNLMKLEEMRGRLKKENSADALRLMIGGDIEGSMAKYNEAGEDKMTDLEFEQESGLVSWVDGKGQEQAAMLPHLMAMVGLNPKDLDTPEAEMGRKKELITHKAQEAKKYGIGRGAGRPTAYIQNLEYTMKKLTGGDARKAFQLMQLSKSDPQTAYSRILIGLQKQNAEAFGEDKMTDDEMRQAAKDSVTSFREDMFKELLGPQEGGGQAPTQPAGKPESVFNQGGQGSDPLKLF